MLARNYGPTGIDKFLFQTKKTTKKQCIPLLQFGEAAFLVCVCVCVRVRVRVRVCVCVCVHTAALCQCKNKTQIFWGTEIAKVRHYEKD